MSGRAPLVCVSGPIGAGKSTIVRALARELQFEALVEREAENPYLERYYRDPRSWAFKNFLFFLEQSLTDQLRAQAHSVGSVQERLPQEHLEVFGREFHARGFLSDDDIALFDRLTKTATSGLASPDLLIYLVVDPKTALTRLERRARKAERAVSLEYLCAIGARYELFIEAWHGCPVLQVDTRELDLRTADAVRQVADSVVQHLPHSGADPHAR